MNDLFGGNQGKGSDGYSAKDIEVLEGLEPVRRRPGMYIGGTDEAALHHLAAELLDNAMDEAVAGHASFIEVTLEPDNWLTVRDNGRGIPVDPHPKFKHLSALEVILTTLHSGGKFGGKVYATSGGLHGVGSSVVNALAEKLQVEVARDAMTGTRFPGRRLDPLAEAVDAPWATGGERATERCFLPSVRSCFANRGMLTWRRRVGHRRQQHLRVGMVGRRKHRIDRPELDQPPAIEQGHVVGHVTHQCDVV